MGEYAYEYGGSLLVVMVMVIDVYKMSSERKMFCLLCAADDATVGFFWLGAVDLVGSAGKLGHLLGRWWVRK